MNITRKCLNCGNKINGHPTKQYCDRSCQQARARREGRQQQRRRPISARHAKACLNPACGKTFLSYDYTAKYCSRDCFQAVIQKPKTVTNEDVRREEAALREHAAQGELFPSRKPTACTCGDIHNCIPCRNAARKKRTQAADTLKPVMAAMSPAVLAVCLEVRALNKGKRAAVLALAANGD